MKPIKTAPTAAGLSHCSGTQSTAVFRCISSSTKGAVQSSTSKLLTNSPYGYTYIGHSARYSNGGKLKKNANRTQFSLSRGRRVLARGFSPLFRDEGSPDVSAAAAVRAFHACVNNGAMQLAQCSCCIGVPSKPVDPDSTEAFMFFPERRSGVLRCCTIAARAAAAWLRTFVSCEACKQQHAPIHKGLKNLQQHKNMLSKQK